MSASQEMSQVDLTQLPQASSRGSVNGPSSINSTNNTGGGGGGGGGGSPTSLSATTSRPTTLHLPSFHLGSFSNMSIDSFVSSPTRDSQFSPSSPQSQSQLKGMPQQSQSPQISPPSLTRYPNQPASHSQSEAGPSRRATTHFNNSSQLEPVSRAHSVSGGSVSNIGASGTIESVGETESGNTETRSSTSSSPSKNRSTKTTVVVDGTSPNTGILSGETGTDTGVIQSITNSAGTGAGAGDGGGGADGADWANGGLVGRSGSGVSSSHSARTTKQRPKGPVPPPTSSTSITTTTTTTTTNTNVKHTLPSSISSSITAFSLPPLSPSSKSGGLNFSTSTSTSTSNPNSNFNLDDNSNAHLNQNSAMSISLIPFPLPAISPVSSLKPSTRSEFDFPQPQPHQSTSSSPNLTSSPSLSVQSTTSPRVTPWAPLNVPSGPRQQGSSAIGPGAAGGTGEGPHSPARAFPSPGSVGVGARRVLAPTLTIHTTSPLTPTSDNPGGFGLDAPPDGPSPQLRESPLPRRRTLVESHRVHKEASPVRVSRIIGSLTPEDSPQAQAQVYGGLVEVEGEIESRGVINHEMNESSQPPSLIPLSPKLTETGMDEGQREEAVVSNSPPTDALSTPQKKRSLPRPPSVPASSVPPFTTTIQTAADSAKQSSFSASAPPAVVTSAPSLKPTAASASATLAEVPPTRTPQQQGVFGNEVFAEPQPIRTPIHRSPEKSSTYPQPATSLANDTTPRASSGPAAVRHRQQPSSGSTMPAIAIPFDSGPYPTPAALRTQLDVSVGLGMGPSGDNSSAGVAGIGVGGAGIGLGRPAGPNPLKPPVPPEEICLECMMRDRDLADVEVSGPGIWDRSSDADWRDLQRKEDEVLHNDVSESDESETLSSPKSGSANSADAHALARRKKAKKRAQRDARVIEVGWRGFRWEEGSNGEGLPPHFRGLKGGPLSEAGIKAVMIKFPSSSAFRYTRLQSYLQNQYRLVLDIRAEAQRLGRFPEPEELCFEHGPIGPALVPIPDVPSTLRPSVPTLRPSPSTPTQLSVDVYGTPSIASGLTPSPRPHTQYIPDREIAVPRTPGSSILNADRERNSPVIGVINNNNLSVAALGAGSRKHGHGKGASSPGILERNPKMSLNYDDGDDYLWNPTASPADANIRPFSFAVRAGAVRGDGASSTGHGGAAGRRSIFGRFGGSATSLFGGSQGGSGSMMDMHLGLDSDQRENIHEYPRAVSMATPSRPSFFRESRTSSVHSRDPRDSRDQDPRDRDRQRSISSSRLAALSLSDDERKADVDPCSGESRTKKKGIKGLFAKMKAKSGRKPSNGSGGMGTSYETDIEGARGDRGGAGGRASEGEYGYGYPHAYEGAVRSSVGYDDGVPVSRERSNGHPLGSGRPSGAKTILSSSVVSGGARRGQSRQGTMDSMAPLAPPPNIAYLVNQGKRERRDSSSSAFTDRSSINSPSGQNYSPSNQQVTPNQGSRTSLFNLNLNLRSVSAPIGANGGTGGSGGTGGTGGSGRRGSSGSGSQNVSPTSSKYVPLGAGGGLSGTRRESYGSTPSVRRRSDGLDNIPATTPNTPGSINFKSGDRMMGSTVEILNGTGSGGGNNFQHQHQHQIHYQSHNSIGMGHPMGPPLGIVGRQHSPHRSYHAHSASFSAGASQGSTGTGALGGTSGSGAGMQAGYGGGYSYSRPHVKATPSISGSSVALDTPPLYASALMFNTTSNTNANVNIGADPISSNRYKNLPPLPPSGQNSTQPQGPQGSQRYSSSPDSFSVPMIDHGPELISRGSKYDNQSLQQPPSHFSQPPHQNHVSYGDFPSPQSSGAGYNKGIGQGQGQHFPSPYLQSSYQPHPIQQSYMTRASYDTGDRYGGAFGYGAESGIKTGGRRGERGGERGEINPRLAQSMYVQASGAGSTTSFGPGSGGGGIGGGDVGEKKARKGIKGFLKGR